MEENRVIRYVRSYTLQEVRTSLHNPVGWFHLI